jgi:exosome complex RNA-binding protein Rrp42 (RNase PH superfamily)
LKQCTQQICYRSQVHLQVEVTSLANGNDNQAEAARRSATLSYMISDLFGSRVLDPKQLSIEQAKHCWALQLYVYILNDDGCLLDACVAAASAALAYLEVRFLWFSEPYKAQTSCRLCLDAPCSCDVSL